MDNVTAMVNCFARAYHFRNNRVRIFDDAFAERLLGDDYQKIAMNMTAGMGFFLPGFAGTPEEGLRLILDRQLSPSVLGRSAFAESALENEKRLGCRQYLIAASGYDTYAMRNIDTSVTVFELDRKEVLEDKKARCEKSRAQTGLGIRSVRLYGSALDGSADRHGLPQGGKDFCKPFRYQLLSG